MIVLPKTGDFDGAAGKAEEKERGGIHLGWRLKESDGETEDCARFGACTKGVGLHAGGRWVRGRNHSRHRRVWVRFCRDFAAGGSGELVCTMGPRSPVITLWTGPQDHVENPQFTYFKRKISIKPKIFNMVTGPRP